MSKTRIICHIVFATKNRRPTISKAHKRELFAYILGIVKNSDCVLIRINGMSDHVHMLVDLHPTMSVSELVRRVKVATNQWMKGNPDFPLFDSWNEGFFAGSVSAGDVEACKEYIKNQESHHSIYPFFNEIEKLVLRNGLEWDPRNWE